MKKLILLALLITASVSFAVIEHDETEATDKVNEAKNAMDGAVAAIDGNLSIFEPYFDKCPEVKEQWDDAVESLNTASERYDQAFDAVELYQSDDAYNNSEQSIAASENVIGILDALPAIVDTCAPATVENETEPTETEPATVEEPEAPPEMEQPPAETPPASQPETTEPEQAPNTGCALSTIIILLSLAGLFLGRG